MNIYRDNIMVYAAWCASSERVGRMHRDQFRFCVGVRRVGKCVGISFCVGIDDA